MTKGRSSRRSPVAATAAVRAAHANRSRGGRHRRASQRPCCATTAGSVGASMPTSTSDRCARRRYRRRLRSAKGHRSARPIRSGPGCVVFTWFIVMFAVLLNEAFVANCRAIPTHRKRLFLPPLRHRQYLSSVVWRVTKMDLLPRFFAARSVSSEYIPDSRQEVIPEEILNKG